MNGRMPPANNLVITALTAYSFWLASGAPVAARISRAAAFRKWPSRRYRRTLHADRRSTLRIAPACHQANGGGLKENDAYTFPPVWGANSYNKGAGMHGVATAASFIKANMPMGQGGTLTDQEAWDVAAYVNSKPRPADPRVALRP